MAFFKFRFPGRNASAEALASGPNENIEVVRRRARYRLIGAVVLVLIAVVGFPLVFDTQPRPVAVDTPIVIPDRQAVAPLTAPAPVTASQMPAKPWKIAPETLSTQAGLDPSEQVEPPSAPVVAPVVKSEPTEKPKEKQADKPKEKTEAAVAKSDKTDAEAKSKSKSKDDGDKAKALLEGKSATAERLIIQVGAFSDAAKLREVRQKLEKGGFKTYTQVVDGKDGKTTTRVRVGPYDSRDDADKAAVRIRKLDLSAAILKL
ncbi:SPOR domain-containing protein [Limnohabitans sp. MMS-10A-160]|uniref:SPOR domain-containing protein n=1 Tax=unclassified Limnohabitans TaxID=2626134 RepID=UPI000D35B92A|nr:MULTISPECIES: SPOR domain-containing protein [unclassified Limnohabitans]PUE21650.1 SPOR domain-containing protein [Limnohabitans sp. MMS-10A-192]PUE26773.1 SPOR domain-containing protein [Limnohabitans sp. MMS-10A-160]